MDILGLITGSKKRREELTEECKKQISSLQNASGEVGANIKAEHGVKIPGIEVFEHIMRQEIRKYDGLLENSNELSEKNLNDLKAEINATRGKMERQLDELAVSSVELAKQGKFDAAEDFMRRAKWAYSALGKTDKIDHIVIEEAISRISQLRKHAEKSIHMPPSIIERVHGTDQKAASEELKFSDYSFVQDGIRLHEQKPRKSEGTTHRNPLASETVEYAAHAKYAYSPFVALIRNIYSEKARKIFDKLNMDIKGGAKTVEALFSENKISDTLPADTGEQARIGKSIDVISREILDFFYTELNTPFNIYDDIGQWPRAEKEEAYGFIVGNILGFLRYTIMDGSGLANSTIEEIKKKLNDVAKEKAQAPPVPPPVQMAEREVRDKVLTLIYESDILYEQGDYDESEKKLKEAKKLANENGVDTKEKSFIYEMDRNRVLALMYSSDMLYGLGRYSEAKEKLNEVKERSRKNNIDISEESFTKAQIKNNVLALIYASDILYEQGDYVKSKERLNEAKELFNKHKLHDMVIPGV